MEAWVYPLKIFREFHLKFHLKDENLGLSRWRDVMVRPESATILLCGRQFTVRETFFRSGAGTRSRDSSRCGNRAASGIEAIFHRDFHLNGRRRFWRHYLDGARNSTRLYFGEEQRKFSALVGSATRRTPAF